MEDTLMPRRIPNIPFEVPSPSATRVICKDSAGRVVLDREYEASEVDPWTILDTYAQHMFPDGPALGGPTLPSLTTSTTHNSYRSRRGS